MSFFGFFGFGFFGIFGFGFFWYFWFGCFGILGFGFLVVSRERVVVYFRSLSTATPTSVRVDSDVVQQAYLNCPKRSGRV